MKKKFLLMAVLGIWLLAAQVGAEEKAVSEEKAALKEKKDRISYSIGADLGGKLKMLAVEVDPSLLAKGLKDAYTGSKSLMNEQEINETLKGFQMEMTAKQQERMKALGEKNKKEGEAFLAENKKKEKVITLPSGLQYRVITEGTGQIPKPTDMVKVNYKGALMDGTEFDSSYKRGQPASFPVNGVIPGWTEALQLMKEGSKWQVFVPSNLAYGERGAGGVIGPNAVLIFEVELISVKSPETKPSENQGSTPQK